MTQEIAIKHNLLFLLRYKKHLETVHTGMEIAKYHGQNRLQNGMVVEMNQDLLGKTGGQRHAKKEK
jgi:hypothetical protein